MEGDGGSEEEEDWRIVVVNKCIFYNVRVK